MMRTVDPVGAALTVNAANTNLDQSTSDNGWEEGVAALGVLVGRAVGIALLKRSAVDGQSGSKDGDDCGELHSD